jgi:hypothetical protein
MVTGILPYRLTIYTTTYNKYNGYNGYNGYNEYNGLAVVGV